MFLTHYLLYHRVSGRLLGKISHQQQHKQGVELLSVHGKQVSTTRQSPFTAEVRVCVCVCDKDLTVCVCELRELRDSEHIHNQII